MASIYRVFIKRLLDVILAGFLLFLLFPIFFLIAYLVYLQMGRPVFFVQARAGRNEKIFRIYKFRTMEDVKNVQGEMTIDLERVTKFGMWLRQTSLDEFPGLWNVLKGDMSLVGPRPFKPDDLPYYTQSERKRFQVLPGITGWAQINGRNKISWDERLALDVWYVEHYSFRLDMKILWLTFFKVIKAENSIPEVGVTMPSLAELRSNKKRENIGLPID